MLLEIVVIRVNFVVIVVNSLEIGKMSENQVATDRPAQKMAENQG